MIKITELFYLITVVEYAHTLGGGEGRGLGDQEVHKPIKKGVTLN